MCLEDICGQRWAEKRGWGGEIGIWKGWRKDIGKVIAVKVGVILLVEGVVGRERFEEGSVGSVGFQSDARDGRGGRDDINLPLIVLGRYAGVLVAHDGGEEERIPLECSWLCQDGIRL